MSHLFGAEGEDLKKRLVIYHQKLQKKSLKKNEIERKYIELQKAHTEQVMHSFTNCQLMSVKTLFLQGLQEENSKFKEIKSTVSMQEVLIAKLEGLLEKATVEYAAGKNDF